MTPTRRRLLFSAIAVLGALLQAGADINATSHSGRTAVMYAAQNGDAATFQILADGGADLNLSNKDGKTALALAATDEVKALLRAHGAKM